MEGALAKFDGSTQSTQLELEVWTGQENGAPSPSTSQSEVDEGVVPDPGDTDDDWLSKLYHIFPSHVTPSEVSAGTNSQIERGTADSIAGAGGSCENQTQASDDEIEDDVREAPGYTGKKASVEVEIVECITIEDSDSEELIENPESKSNSSDFDPEPRSAKKNSLPESVVATPPPSPLLIPVSLSLAVRGAPDGAEMEGSVNLDFIAPRHVNLQATATSSGTRQETVDVEAQVVLPVEFSTAEKTLHNLDSGLIKTSSRKRKRGREKEKLEIFKGKTGAPTPCTSSVSGKISGATGQKNKVDGEKESFSSSSDDEVRDPSWSLSTWRTCSSTADANRRKWAARRQIQSHAWQKPKKLFKCPKCLRRLSSKAALVGHDRTHTGEKPFRCPQCPKTFAQRGGLESHVWRRHDRSPRLRLQCTFLNCPRTFLKLEALHRHLREHRGEKPFKCYFCEKGMNQSGGLMLHMRMHTRERPYRCGECPCEYTASQNLKYHQLIKHPRV